MVKKVKDGKGSGFFVSFYSAPGRVILVPGSLRVGVGLVQGQMRL